MIPDDHNPYAQFIVEPRDNTLVMITCLAAASGCVALLFWLLIR